MDSGGRAVPIIEVRAQCMWVGPQEAASVTMVVLSVLGFIQ